jgi:hypothetical protein
VILISAEPLKGKRRQLKAESVRALPPHDPPLRARRLAEEAGKVILTRIPAKMALSPVPAKQYWKFQSLGRLERVKGIEPSYSAWKAAALPLSYTR